MSLKKGSRKQELSELAEAVASEYCPTGQVDPEHILKQESIGFGFGQYGDSFDGMLEYQVGKFYVYANLDKLKHRNSARSRFTLAHELGHFFIDSHRISIKQGAGQHQSSCGMFDRAECKEESEADSFAANLLMPPARLLTLLKKQCLRSPLEQIKAIADHFNSSLTSSALQFIANSPTPTAAISWNPEGICKWVRLADEMRHDEKMRYWATPKFRDVSDAPKDSATALVLKSGESDAITSTTAAFIFPNVKSGGYRDPVLVEECISLGQYGALTIVSLPPENKF